MCRTGTYSGKDSGADAIEHIQTHLSHVFLTRERVYKLRKAVVFDFVDFGSREARRVDCVEEVRLNRRLASDVYLGVAEVFRATDGFRVGAPAEDLSGAGSEAEPIVVMRRLPPERDAVSLLRAGQLSAARMEDVARQIAVFHSENRLPPSPGSDDWQRATAAPVWEAIESLKDLGGSQEELLRALDWRTREFEALHGYRFARRLAAGRRVDGHGDLHLQHLWFDDDGGARIIDCLEFSSALRQIDAACDIAFLTMDLRYRGRGDLAERVLAVYTEEADDYDLFGVLRYFESYRAVVRAKVAHLATRDPAIASPQRDAAAESRRRHLDLANRLFREPSRGDVIVTSGSIGSGKSTVARALAKRLCCVRIATDRVRKRRAGVARDVAMSGGWNRGDYSVENRRAVYAALREAAAEVLRSGRSVVLDATFSSREERDALQRWLREKGVRAWLIHTVCPDAIVESRLRARKRAGGDDSDAGPELLAASRSAYCEPEEWPEDRRIRVDTSGRGWQAKIDEFASRVGAARFG